MRPRIVDAALPMIPIALHVLVAGLLDQPEFLPAPRPVLEHHWVVPAELVTATYIDLGTESFRLQPYIYMQICYV